VTLRDARSYVASFNRPNLTCRAIPKSSPYEPLLTFIGVRPSESGIVYGAQQMNRSEVAEAICSIGSAYRFTTGKIHNLLADAFIKTTAMLLGPKLYLR